MTGTRELHRTSTMHTPVKMGISGVRRSRSSLCSWVTWWKAFYLFGCCVHFHYLSASLPPCALEDSVASWSFPQCSRCSADGMELRRTSVLTFLFFLVRTGAASTVTIIVGVEVERMKDRRDASRLTRSWWSGSWEVAVGQRPAFWS